MLSDFLPAAQRSATPDQIHRAEELLKHVAIESLLKHDILAQLDSKETEKVLKCYIRIQKGLRSASLKAEIKLALIEQSQESI